MGSRLSQQSQLLWFEVSGCRINVLKLLRSPKSHEEVCALTKDTPWGLQSDACLEALTEDQRLRSGVAESGGSQDGLQASRARAIEVLHAFAIYHECKLLKASFSFAWLDRVQKKLVQLLSLAHGAQERRHDERFS